MIRAAVALAIGMLAAPAHAQTDATADTMTYRVKQGDSLELIAAEFYGDRKHDVFIVAENKLQHSHSVYPGERIKIPVTREIATATGDTFKKLAATYLGDERRAPFLADFNNMSVDDSIPAGTLITIPFHVIHTATAPESLASISATYLGDAKQAELLELYNNLDKTSLDKGESIIVPVLHVRVRAGKLPAIDGDAKARRDLQHKASEDAIDALPRARDAWIQGNFEGVRSALHGLADELDYLPTDQAVEACVLLGKADVAFGDTDQAVAAFAQVLARKPRFTLSTYSDSPTVLAAWKKAGGRVEGD